MRGIVWLRIAVVYLVIGVSFGMYIGIAQLFELSSVHAHLNLLGWATLGIAGVMYCQFPTASKSKLGIIHFWLHNIGLPVMCVGLYLQIMKLSTLPLIEIGGTVAILGIIAFAFNVFMNMKQSAKV